MRDVERDSLQRLSNKRSHEGELLLSGKVAQDLVALAGNMAPELDWVVWQPACRGARST